MLLPATANHQLATAQGQSGSTGRRVALLHQPQAMRKILQIKDQTLDLVFNEGANCWQTKTLINNTEIEIDFQFYRQPEVDWLHFQKFDELSSQREVLTELVRNSEHTNPSAYLLK